MEGEKRMRGGFEGEMEEDKWREEDVENRWRETHSCRSWKEIRVITTFLQVHHNVEK